jgi:ketosteroid isomerase-like protein
MVESVKTLIATFDAYADNDFDRLADLYAEDVTWSGTKAGPWDCMNREDVLGMFRVGMRRGKDLTFDQMLSIGSRVLLIGHDEENDQFVAVFTVQDRQVVQVQEYASRDAALDALKRPPQ